MKDFFHLAYKRINGFRENYAYLFQNELGLDTEALINLLNANKEQRTVLRRRKEFYATCRQNAINRRNGRDLMLVRLVDSVRENQREWARLIILFKKTFCDITDRDQCYGLSKVLPVLRRSRISKS